MNRKFKRATSSDIFVGNKIYYCRMVPDEYDNEYIYVSFISVTIDEVLKPNDPWKAYVGTDGCRYGLDEALVEDKIDSIDPVVRSLRAGEEIIQNQEPTKWKDISDNQLKSEIPNLTELCKTVALRSIKSFNKELSEEDALSKYEQWRTTASTGVSIPDCDDIDFGDKNFSITFPSLPIEFYVTKVFKCPICGYEADHHTNLEGEPKNKPFCPECFRKANIPIMNLKED